MMVLKPHMTVGPGRYTRDLALMRSLHVMWTHMWKLLGGRLSTSDTVTSM